MPEITTDLDREEVISLICAATTILSKDGGGESGEFESLRSAALKLAGCLGESVVGGAEETVAWMIEKGKGKREAVRGER